MSLQEKSDNEPELTQTLEAARDDAISLALQARGGPAVWSAMWSSVKSIGPSLPLHMHLARSQAPGVHSC